MAYIEDTVNRNIARMFKELGVVSSPCDTCIHQSNCKNQDKANGISICEMFKPNILVTVRQSLSFSYPQYRYVTHIDITTGFLKIAVFNTHKTSSGETEQDANPIKILTIKTNPFVDKFGFTEEIRYKMNRLNA